MKDIPGHEGRYAVTEEGKVWSHISRRWLKPKVAGYVSVKMDGKLHLVHRLVAITYLPNPDGKRVVNHKDSDKSNNRLINLEWMTHKENTQHAMASGNPFGRPSKLSTAEVGAILALRGHVKQKDLASRFDVSQVYIAKLQARSNT